MSTLSDLLPDRIDGPDATARVVDVDGTEADEVLDALSSDTRRNVYRALFEEPATASELSEELETTIQNVSHHLSALEEVQLVEGIGHRYSDTGNEMVVYGPASDPIVFVGEEESRREVRNGLADLATGVGLLAGASLLIQWGSYRLVGDPGGNGTLIDPAGLGAAGEATHGRLAWLVFEAGEPGLVFFFACLLVAGTVAALARR